MTLAVGQCYAKMALSLLRDLSMAGNATLVVTDVPLVFVGSDIEVVPFQAEAAHVWHSKRRAIREGLKRAKTAYFIDADHKTCNWMKAPQLACLPDGTTSWLGGQLLGDIKFGWPRDFQAEKTLDLLSARMDVANWRILPWLGDYLYAVTRDEAGKWIQFLESWDRFVQQIADIPSLHPLILGDGVALTFAAHLSGLQVNRDPAALAPLARVLVHLGLGDWRN